MKFRYLLEMIYPDKKILTVKNCYDSRRGEYLEVLCSDNNDEQELIELSIFEALNKVCRHITNNGKEN